MLKSRGSLRFAQRLDLSRTCAGVYVRAFVRGDRLHEAAPAVWGGNLHWFSFAEGGLRAKSRTVELGKFRAPVCTYL